MRRARVLTIVLAGAAALPPASSAVAAELPLGSSSLDERRTRTAPAPGVARTHIVRGHASPGGAAGPWRLDVLRIGRGTRLAVELSNGVVPGRETVSAMARRVSAVAAVNGGFFGSQGAFDGDLIGALALGGQLVSEPVGGRAALVLPAPGGRPRVAGLRFAGAVRGVGESRLLDGVNRARGLIPSCGGRGGDLPSQRPGAAVVCSDASELVQLTPAFGTRTGTDGRGVEAIVRSGVVTRLREGGNSRIPADGYVLSGSGDAAAFLERVAAPGARPAVDLALRAGSKLLRPGSWEAIVGGGPRLVKRGRLRVRTVPEGFSAAFAGRNPRTLAGVTRAGELLLVTIDGRRPRHSVGVTLVEAARVMRALGAREALNLDGGGSSAMVVGGRVVNRPSDGTERAVSDALVVLPG
jgi:Phosphodiester glycosidase